MEKEIKEKVYLKKEIGKVYPILINYDKQGKKQIGIEYKNGKYVLIGKGNMDKGVKIFFEKLSEILQGHLSQETQKLVEEIEKEKRKIFNSEKFYDMEEIYELLGSFQQIIKKVGVEK